MDIKQLKTFLVLSKLKNYTKTAAELDYAQSSISAQIQQLEQELNTKLFDRIGKNIYLTASGKMLIPYANEILSLSANAKERINFDSSSRGQIVIGASESLCIFLLPKIIKAFMNLHPNIELKIKLTDNEQVIRQLTNNEFDIAFTIGNPIAHSSITNLHKRAEKILILSDTTHPLTSKKRLEIHDFANQTFILTGAGCNYRAAFEHDMHSNGVPYKIALETGSVQTIKEMAVSGLGICVLPQMAVQKELEANLLCALPYSNNYSIYSQIFCHNSKWISRYLSDLIKMIQDN